MTIAELIIKLQSFPPDCQVVAFNSFDGISHPKPEFVEITNLKETRRVVHIYGNEALGLNSFGDNEWRWK